MYDMRARACIIMAQMDGPRHIICYIKAAAVSHVHSRWNVWQAVPVRSLGLQDLIHEVGIMPVWCKPQCRPRYFEAGESDNDCQRLSRMCSNAHLRSADVAGGLVAANVLLAGLHGHTQRRLALQSHDGHRA